MTLEDLVPIPVPAASLASALASHGDYRIARRVQPMVRGAAGFERTDELSVCVLDCETTGTDHETDKVIELALQRVYVSTDGRIVMTGKPRNWLEDPGVPISPEITRITGLTDDDVKGQAIAESEARSVISSADVVLSHNAGFDRPFVEKRLGLSGLAWACSLNDIDWREVGFEGRSLGQLLWQCGWFYEAHRASSDVNALLHLLDHRLSSGTTVMKEVLERARRPSWVIDAVGAPFSARGALKTRGYRWYPAVRFWWREVSDEALEDELAWVAAQVYGGMETPPHRQITWCERHGARS
ncbi:MAG TPA: 3'-5' exonuclease [Allosphingosinicella sp.]